MNETAEEDKLQRVNEMGKSLLLRSPERWSVFILTHQCLYPSHVPSIHPPPLSFTDVLYCSSPSVCFPFPLLKWYLKTPHNRDFTNITDSFFPSASVFHLLHQSIRGRLHRFPLQTKVGNLRQSAQTAPVLLLCIQSFTTSLRLFRGPRLCAIEVLMPNSSKLKEAEIQLQQTAKQTASSR